MCQLSTIKVYAGLSRERKVYAMSRYTVSWLVNLSVSKGGNMDKITIDKLTYYLLWAGCILNVTGFILGLFMK